MSKCFIPRCKCNPRKDKKKIFLRVPNDPKIRRRWYEAANFEGNPNTMSKQLCCEDHFELERDAQNWLFYETIGNKIILKPGLVPHKHINDSPPSDYRVSAFTDYARKKKLQNLFLYRRKRSQVNVFIGSIDIKEEPPSSYIEPEFVAVKCDVMPDDNV